MDPELARRGMAAAAIAREAGVLARRLFCDRNSLQTDLKATHDYITAADKQVEELIVQRLAGLFPEDTCLGEERGGTLSKNLWVIDPIDGTANFAHGIAHFAISIAYLENTIPMVGAIYVPADDLLYTAQRHCGAFRDGVPIRVSACGDPRRAYIEVGFSNRYPLADYTNLLEALLSRGLLVRWGGSAVRALANVAEGTSEAYCDLHLNAWDAAAGVLLVNEAGGWVSDFFADAALTNGNPLVACAPGIAGSIAEASRRIFPPSTFPKA